MKQVRYFFGVAVFLIVLLGCGASGAPETGEEAVETRQVAVETTTLAPRTIRDFIVLSGEIEAPPAVAALPETAGELTVLNATVGQRVQRGNEIARVDPSQPGRRFAESPVRAPISGTVTSVPVQLGQQVSPQSSIALIVDIAQSDAVIRVPERFIGQVRVGQRVRLLFDAYPGIDFSATVRRRASQLDPQARTLEVRAGFDRWDERILPGMTARAEIVLTERVNALVVPQQALLRRDGSVFVFVVTEDEVASLREVTTGIEIDGEAELVSGVRDGDRIVTRGQNLLEDGSPVLVIR